MLEEMYNVKKNETVFINSLIKISNIALFIKLDVITTTKNALEYIKI